MFWYIKAVKPYQADIKLWKKIVVELAKIHSNQNQLLMVRGMLDHVLLLAKGVPTNAQVMGSQANVVGIPMLISVISMQNDVVKKLTGMVDDLYEDMESITRQREYDTEMARRQ